MAKQRINRSPAGAADIASAGFNPQSGGHKYFQVGPSFKNSNTTNPLQTAGQIFSTAQGLSAGEVVWIFNTAGTVKFFTLYKAGATVAAPTDCNTGIPSMPGQWMQVSAGFNDRIVAQDATLFMFRIEDDTSLTDL